MKNFGIRNILKTGSTVFGMSAVLLIALPSQFLELLALDSDSQSTIWSMRMIGITLANPAGVNWFSALYALVGFGFGCAYLVALILKRY